MDKLTLAQYLVNLHTLLAAQSSSAHSVPSAVLGAEYDRNWALLKEKINDETRTEHEQERRPETGADQPRSQPLRRG